MYLFKKNTINFQKKIVLKAVLFDMDGVIVDSEPLHKKAFILFQMILKCN